MSQETEYKHVQTVILDNGRSTSTTKRREIRKLNEKRELREKLRKCKILVPGNSLYVSRLLRYYDNKKHRTDTLVRQFRPGVLHEPIIT